MRETIKNVSTGRLVPNRLPLVIEGRRSDGSHEIGVFEFDDAPRMDTFMRTLGYSMC